MTLTKAQLELRRTKITASDVPAIVGEHPWRTQMDVYASKHGPPEEHSREHTERMRAGHAAEGAIAKLYVQRLADQGQKIQVYAPPGLTMCHHMFEWAAATPDRFVFESERMRKMKMRSFIKTGGANWLLECKLVGPSVWKHWALENETGDGISEDIDRIPPYVALQVQWQMWVCNYRRCDVAALLGTNFRVFRIDIDEQLIKTIVPMCREFYDKHVKGDELPEPDGSANYSKGLSRVYRTVDTQAIIAPSGAHEYAMKYTQFQKEEAEAKKKKEEASQHLKGMLGANESMIANWGMARWILTKGKVNYSKLVADLKIDEQVLAKYRTPSRRLHVSYKGMPEQVIPDEELPDV